jgi:hypothetical protein
VSIYIQPFFSRLPSSALVLIRLALLFNPPELLDVRSGLAVAFPELRPASPGTMPAPVRLAMSARMEPSHLISSSSLGALSSRVRLVVTILNEWVLCVSSASSPGSEDVTEVATFTGLCRVGSSYSSASRISEKGNIRPGLVSCRENSVFDGIT